MPSSGMMPYKHSNVARGIVNRIVVGQLNDQAITFTGRIKSISEHLENLSVKVFTIKPVDHTSPLPGASELGHLGKHHLIRCASLHGVSRHYTITNCLKEEIYQDYLNAIS